MDGAAQQPAVDSLDIEEQHLFWIDNEPAPFVPGGPPAWHSYDYVAPDGDSFATLPILGVPSDIASSEHVKLKGATDTRTCFNCGGDHVLSECPFRRDYRVIAANRAAFTAQKQTLGNGAERGKVGGDGTERDQMLAYVNTFKPGRASQNLRVALGLREHELCLDWPELPFYRTMLIWGYPPGWLAQLGELGNLDTPRGQQADSPTTQILSRQ